MSDRTTPVILWVRWVDSASQHGWLQPEQLPERPLIAETVGFIAGETNDHLLLALSRGVNDDCAPWADVISIPKCAITARTELILRDPD